MRNKILMFAAIAAVFIALWMSRGYIHFGEIVSQAKQAVIYKGDTTTHWRDEYNREHAKNKVLQQSFESAQITHKKEIHAAAVLAGVKDKQIEGLMDYVVTLHGQLVGNVDTTQRGDTTSSFHVSDEFSDIFGFALNDTQQVVNYNMVAPVSWSAYWQRRNVFLGIRYGNIEHFIDGYSTNPNVRLDSISNVQILTRGPGRWGAGIQCGYGTMDSRNFGPYVGIGVTYNFIRWGKN